MFTHLIMRLDFTHFHLHIFTCTLSLSLSLCGCTKICRSQIWKMPTVVLRNVCIKEFDFRCRGVEDWYVAIHGSPFTVAYWNLFLSVDGRLQSLTVTLTPGLLQTEHALPLKLDCVQSLTGSSATWSSLCEMIKGQGHFVNQHFYYTHSHTNVRNLVLSLVIRSRLRLLYQRESFCCGLFKACVSTD
jgi:hypothetical protein